MGKRWIPVVFGIVDVALLGVIITSAATGWRIGGKSDAKTGFSIVGDSVLSTEGDRKSDNQLQDGSEKETTFLAQENKDIDETEKRSGKKEKETTAKEKENFTGKENDSATKEETTGKEKNSSLKEKSTDKENNADANVQTTDMKNESAARETQALKESYPAAGEVSTSESPTLADIEGFRWSKESGPYWENRSADAAAIDAFDAVKGGWKAYLLDDPAMKRSEYSVEHLANIEISGSEKAAVVTIHWEYTFLGETGEGYDDGSPDAVFDGAWSGGQIEALGSGKITLRGFYYLEDREYAVGEMVWPDGVEAVIALVRP